MNIRPRLSSGDKAEKRAQGRKIRAEGGQGVKKLRNGISWLFLGRLLT